MDLDLSRAIWRKASASNGTGGECVEVASSLPLIALRDSKNPEGNVLVIDHAAWRGFLADVCSGRFG